MAKTINKVILLGNVGKDPEAKALPSGVMIANFSLATSDKSGAKKETTEWSNCVAFGKLAEIILQYVKKGSKIYVEGRIQTRSWDKDGQKQYRTEIVVNEMCLLGDKGHDAAPQDRSYATKKQQFDDATGITDEDIPF